MMSLLDLPPEIFKQIVADVVDFDKVEGAWKLRLICRSFDREISVHILSALPNEAFDTPAALHILNQNIAYYIAYRIKNTRDVQPELSAKIGQMAEYLQEELGIKSETERWQLLIELCKGLGPNITLDKDMRIWAADPPSLLWYTSISDYGIPHGTKMRLDMKELSIDLTHADRLTAVLAIGDIGLIQKNLNELPDHQPYHSFGSPIFIAVRMQKPAVLSVIIDFVASRVGKRAKRYLVLNSAAFNACNALRAAISTHQVAIVDQLLVYLQTHVPKPNYDIYQMLISRAIEVADANCIRAVLSAVLNDQNRKVFEVNHCLFLLACRIGSEDCVKALLVDGGMNIHSGHMKTSPIFIAIRSGSDPMLGVVIDSGADMNLSLCGRCVRGSKYPTSTPVEYVIHTKRLTALSYLLARGAEIPPISTWPTHSKMYQILREQKMIREGCQVPELKRFKVMNDIERAAL